MSRMDVCYQKDESIVSRDIAGEMILVPIRQSVGDLESIYTLNEVAACVWGLIDGETRLDAIKDEIVSQFEVDADEAKRDLIELIDQLEEAEAIHPVDTEV